MRFYRKGLIVLLVILTMAVSPHIAFGAPTISLFGVTPTPLAPGVTFTATVGASADVVRGVLFLDFRPTLPIFFPLPLTFDGANWKVTSPFPKITFPQGVDSFQIIMRAVVYNAAGQQAIQEKKVTLQKELAQPFTVKASAHLTSGVAPLDVSFSATTTGTITKYEWDFEGDGTFDFSSATSPAASHTYPTPGTFHPTIQVTAADGKTATDTVEITVTFTNHPPVAEANGPYQIDLGDGVNLNGSASSDPDAAFGDSIVSFEWDLNNDGTFGDATGVNPTLTVAQLATFGINTPGSFPIGLRVTDTFGATGTDAATIDVFQNIPVAVANATPTTVAPGELITFDHSTSSHQSVGHHIVSYQWDFDSDGTFDFSTADATEKPQHAYPFLAGILSRTETAALRVTDNNSPPKTATDTVEITVTFANNPPVAKAGGPYTIELGQGVTLNGSASSDPDAATADSIVSYEWDVDNDGLFGDVIGVNPTLTAAELAALGINAAGPFPIALQVKDTFGATGTNGTTLTVNLPPAPPVLNPIGNRTVVLGSALTLTLTATDPNNDPLTFSASPLPLPANASLGGTTGVFTFHPSADQVGTIILTFIVSDGALTDSETITITVQGPPQGSVTALTGRILDTNDFTQGITTPVVGATVSLLNTGFSTSSDVNGNFTLTGVPGGEQILDINAATANPAPDSSPYAGFREKTKLIEGVTNVVDRPFFLPRIATESLTTVNPNATTIVENPTLGVMIEIPPHTAKNPDGSDFTGQISISEVPEGLAPAALPEELQPGLLITIQPVGVTFATPVPITFPNIDNLTPGSEVDIWSLDPTTGTFVVVGTGQVTADGARIETIAGGVRAADWHAALPPAPNGETPSNGSENNSDNQTPNQEAEGCTGSRTAMASGNLTIEHPLTSYRSLGVSRAPRLVYRSLNADPQPVISANTTILRQAAIPPTVSARFRVGGVDLGTEVFTKTSGLNENTDETIRQVVQFDGSGFATGRYPYRMTLTSNYAASSISSFLSGNVLVNNQRNSSLGADWSLAELHRLHLDKVGNALITEGDGSSQFFRLAQLGSGLIAYWPFDDGADPTADVAGGHDGALMGATFTTTDIAPVPGNVSAVVFANQGNHIVMEDPDAFSFGPTSPMSISLWLKQTAARGVYHVFGKRDGCGIINYQLARDGRLVHFSSGSDLLFLGADFPFNTWTHVTITYNGAGSIKMYLNGVEAVSRDNFVMTGESSAPFRIGTSGTCPASQTFPGLIDEVQIYNRALTPEEVAALATGITAFQTEYVSPPGDFSTLVKNADSTFTRTLKDGTQFRFDARGLHTATVDRDGNTTAYTYDVADWLISITDPVGLVTTLTYTGGLLSDITNPAGRTTAFAHDADGNLTRITDPDGASKQFAYDARHRLTSQVSKGGFTTTYGYDFAGRNMSANRPDGSKPLIAASQTIGLVDLSTGLGTKSNPAPVARPSEAVAIFTDGNGNDANFETDRFGASTKVTDALGKQMFIVRDANSNPTQITRPNSAVTTMTYDPRGNLLTVTEQSIGATTTFTYESKFNQVTSIKDPNGNTTTINYDTKGNPTSIVDALGKQTTMTYNPQGLLTSVIDALGHTTTFDYNAQGLLMRVTDPLGRTTLWTYDAAGNVLSVTDALGRTTFFTYDSMNQLLTTTDANGGVTRFTYDANGNLLTLTDAKNQVTRYTYDALDRLLTVTNPLGDTESYTYDANGNLKSLTTRNGVTTQYEYNARDELIKKTVPGVGDFRYQYDAIGQLLSASDPDSVVSYAYDLANRLTSASTVGSPGQPQVTLSYQYDKVGVRIQMDDPTGTTIYGYDALNRLKSLTNSHGQTWTWDFDPAGRLTSQANPNNTAVSLSFDNADQLLQIKHLLGVNPLAQFDYVPNAVGNRTQQTEQVGVSSRTRNFGYDNLDRLLSSSNVPETFNFDAVGNQLQNGQNHDAANRLRLDNDFTYQYDRNGNLISKTQIGDSQTTIYTWDAENQFIGVTTPTTTISYRYDVLGRRIEKNVNGVITRYVYDGLDLLLEANGSNQLTVKHTFGAGIDRPLMREEVDAGLNTVAAQIYHQDGNNNVVTLTDMAGNIVESYEYSAFGKLSVFDANHNALTTPPRTSFTFTGREFDPETGLFYYRTRYYDPSIGRFISEDPIGFLSGDANFYAYVSNNPINWRDPLGLDFLTEFQDGTYEALNAMAGGFGPSTGNEVAEFVGGVAGIIAPTPGGKLKAATKLAKCEKEAAKAAKVAKTTANKLSRAAQVAEKGHTQQATEALKEQKRLRDVSLGEKMRSVERSQQEERAAWRRGEYE